MDFDEWGEVEGRPVLLATVRLERGFPCSFRVLDERSGAPVEGAWIHVDGHLAAVSDASGLSRAEPCSPRALVDVEYRDWRWSSERLGLDERLPAEQEEEPIDIWVSPRGAPWSHQGHGGRRRTPRWQTPRRARSARGLVAASREADGVPAPTGDSCGREAATAATADVSGLLGERPRSGRGLVTASREADGIAAPTSDSCGREAATAATADVSGLLGERPRSGRGLVTASREADGIAAPTSDWASREAWPAQLRRRTVRPMITPHARCAARTERGVTAPLGAGAASLPRGEVRCPLLRTLRRARW